MEEILSRNYPMKANTKVVFLIGRNKDKEGVVVSKKGVKCGTNELVVLVGDEKMVVNKLNVTKK